MGGPNSLYRNFKYIFLELKEPSTPCKIYIKIEIN